MDYICGTVHCRCRCKCLRYGHLPNTADIVKICPGISFTISPLLWQPGSVYIDIERLPAQGHQRFSALEWPHAVIDKRHFHISQTFQLTTYCTPFPVFLDDNPVCFPEILIIKIIIDRLHVYRKVAPTENKSDFADSKVHVTDQPSPFRRDDHNPLLQHGLALPHRLRIGTEDHRDSKNSRN